MYLGCSKKIKLIVEYVAYKFTLYIEIFVASVSFMNASYVNIIIHGQYFSKNIYLRLNKIYEIEKLFKINIF